MKGENCLRRWTFERSLDFFYGMKNFMSWFYLVFSY